MIQNLKLADAASGEELLIASNPSCQFTSYLQEKFKRPLAIDESVIKGVMNNFDAKERAGVVFRGELVSWLWERNNKEVICKLE